MLVPAEDPAGGEQHGVNLRLDYDVVYLAVQAYQFINLLFQLGAGEQRIAACRGIDDPEGLRRVAGAVDPLDFAVGLLGRVIVVVGFADGQDDPLEDVPVHLQRGFIPFPEIVLGQAIAPHDVGKARFVGSIFREHPAEVTFRVEHARQGRHHLLQGLRLRFVQGAREQRGGEDVPANRVARKGLVAGFRGVVERQHVLGRVRPVHLVGVSSALEQQALGGCDVVEIKEANGLDPALRRRRPARFGRWDIPWTRQCGGREQHRQSQSCAVHGSRLPTGAGSVNSDGHWQAPARQRTFRPRDAVFRRRGQTIDFC